MKLSKVYIKNFRAISEVEVSLTDNTTLIGSNGVGKSCILKAIERFFAKSAHVSIEDFHDRNTADPIEIGLTFSELEVDELERFSTRVHNGELKVVRVFYSNLGARENGRYYGFAYRHDDFEAVRALATANERKAAYNALADTGAFDGLVRHNRIEDCLSAMNDWEADHSDQCQLARDDGQFEGFSNVARGSLQKFVSYVFIPAVRDAASDAVDSKNSVLGQLLELFVKAIVQGKKDILDFQKQVDEKYKELVSPDKIGELGGLSQALSETLKNFYGDSEIALNWREVDTLPLPLPVADAQITEQGYTGPIEGKGHGLQRAFIFTILQHLAVALHSPPVDAGGEEVSEEGEEAYSHSIIIAIEEPELYQHPTKQRHFAQVLRRLGQLDAHAGAKSVQLILCSHSPHFLSTDRFEEIRVVQRRLDEDAGATNSDIRSVSYADVIGALAAVGEGEVTLTEEGLKARLHTLNPTVAEGFFAKKVILVEGASDEAAIRAACELKEKSLEAEGVALVEVGGKGNLDKPKIIFDLLGVKTFIVFDCDEDKKPNDQKPEINRCLQRLSGCTEPIDFRTHVCDEFASFRTNLEDVLRDEIGADRFDEVVNETGAVYSLEPSRVKKCPIPMGTALRLASIRGSESETLNKIVEQIFAL